MSHLILERAITAIIAQTLGITKAYNEAMEQLNTLVDIFQRNPALLQTEKLVEAIAKLRRKMIALKTMFKGILIDVEGEQLNNAKIIENLAHPYLKSAHRDTQSTLVIRGKEMADALRSTANLPLLKQLGLKDIVDEISVLAHEADELLYARGEEKAYRKALGSAGKTRDRLEKQLRFLLYTTIPAHYTEATGSQLIVFDRVVMDINGVLDSFRHLVGGGSSDWSSNNPDDNGSEGNDPEDNKPGGDEDNEYNPPPGWEDPDA
ncbi:MAG: DUF6261 family protein [Mediterranea sp.]|nr:DUF6261 family protein [Mediterranea sp.]